MSFPAYNDTSSFQGPQQMELEQFVSYLQGYLSAQHKDDGSHAAITADSLTLAQPASPIITGNVTNDLVPTKNATFNLGAAVAFQTIGLAWANLYLSTAMYLGSVSSGGGNPVIGPLISDIFSGATRTTSIFGPTGGTQFWTVKSPTGGTLIILGGGGLVGPGFFHDDVVTIPAALKLTGTVGADAGLYERLRSAKLGEWITPIFASTDYTANGGMTWTVAAGNVLTSRYTLIGKTLIFSIEVTGTSVSGGNTTLQFNIPGGFTANQTMESVIRFTDNGTTVTGTAFVLAGGTTIGFRRFDQANLAASAGATSVLGQVVFEIQ